MCVSVGVCAYLWFPLKDDHSAPLVPCGQELSCVVELNSGDDISCRERDIETKMERGRERERERGRERERERERWREREGERERERERERVAIS